MKKTGKKNQGFSLVELIVVVLIIGVIGIALAPQVMKWVDASKINTDVNNAESLQSSVQAALADWQNDGGKLSILNNATAVFKIDKDGKKLDGDGVADTLKYGTDAAPETGKDPTSLEAYIDTVTGGDYPKSKYDNLGFIIEVTGEGKVTVKCNAQDPKATTPLVPTPTETE